MLSVSVAMCRLVSMASQFEFMIDSHLGAETVHPTGSTLLRQTDHVACYSVSFVDVLLIVVSLMDVMFSLKMVLRRIGLMHRTSHNSISWT